MNQACPALRALAGGHDLLGLLKSPLPQFPRGGAVTFELRGEEALAVVAEAHRADADRMAAFAAVEGVRPFFGDIPALCIIHCVAPFVLRLCFHRVRLIPS